MSDVPVLLKIRDSMREPTKATLNIGAIPAGARVLRAVKRFLIFFAIAFPAAIPPPHLIFPSILIITGVVMAILTVRRSVDVKSTEVTCPKCNAVTPIEKGTTGWPVPLWCKHCSTVFRATLSG